MNTKNSTKEAAVLPLQGFVRLPTILSVFPVGKTTWWVGVKSGKYPQSVKLGPRITAWRAEDIRALLARENYTELPGV